MFVPIVIFAFNRLDALEITIDSLLKNDEACESDLHVFVDGPRSDIAEDDAKVRSVQEYVKNIRGFKSLTYYFSDENRGLGPSIISGVTKIVEEYGSAIIVEDDLWCAPNFLCFMNQGLQKYKDESRIFSICGYSNKIRLPKKYDSDAYFCVRSSSWGWATWLDRWESIDWSLENWTECEKNAKAFNKWGGSDCFGMLRGWKHGRNKSWAIRFCYSQFIQDKLSVFPIRSKVLNNGFDGQGTNCGKWSRFNAQLDTTNIKDFKWPNTIEVNRVILKSALSYHSIAIRIWTKLMNLLSK